MTKIPNKTEKSLLRLAEMLKIPPKHGWKTRLAEYLGISANVIVRWIGRNKIPSVEIDNFAKKGYRPDKWLLTEEPYPIAEEKMLPGDTDAGRDSDAAQAGRSGIERHQPVKLVVSDDDWYIEAVRQILASEETAVADALKANVRQFHEQIRDKARLRKMEKKIWELEKAREAAGPPKGGVIAQD